MKFWMTILFGLTLISCSDVETEQKLKNPAEKNIEGSIDQSAGLEMQRTESKDFSGLGCEACPGGYETRPGRGDSTACKHLGGQGSNTHPWFNNVWSDLAVTSFQSQNVWVPYYGGFWWSALSGAICQDYQGKRRWKIKGAQVPAEPPPPTGPSQEIKGWVDSVSREQDSLLIRGWACAEGVQSSVDVHAYVGGEYGAGGRFFGSASANRPTENAVNTACQTPSGFAHRYEIKVADTGAIAGQQLVIYGISPVGKSNPVIGKWNAPAYQGPSEELKGHVDSVTRQRDWLVIRGWACAEGVHTSVDVHAYGGGAAGAGGRFIGSAKANRSTEKGVNTACQTPSGLAHRFEIMVADTGALAGQKIVVHGISPVGKVNRAIGSQNAPAGR